MSKVFQIFQVLQRTIHTDKIQKHKNNNRKVKKCNLFIFIEENKTITELLVDQSAVESFEFRLQCKKRRTVLWMTDELTALSSKNKNNRINQKQLFFL